MAKDMGFDIAVKNILDPSSNRHTDFTSHELSCRLRKRRRINSIAIQVSFDQVRVMARGWCSHGGRAYSLALTPYPPLSARQGSANQQLNQSTN
jgi:hypothetical protein